MWLPCGKSDSQVEPGFSVLESFGGDGVKITFPEQHVVLPPDFDLGSGLRVEEHAIFWLDRSDMGAHRHDLAPGEPAPDDRKSTRLNSSHTVISYAVFCLKKKKK